MADMSLFVGTADVFVAVICLGFYQRGASGWVLFFAAFNAAVAALNLAQWIKG